MFSRKNKMFSTKNYNRLNSPKRLDEKTQLLNDLKEIYTKKLKNSHVSPPPSPPGEKSLSFPLTLPPPMEKTKGRIPYTHFVYKKPDGTLVSESALGLTKRKRRKTKRAVRSQFPRRKTKGKKTKRR